MPARSDRPGSHHRRALLLVLAVLGWLWLPRPRAHAEPGDDDPVEHPPKPDDADGVARPARNRGRDALWLPRAVLYLPRRAVTLATTPVRLGMWAYDRYDLRSLFYRVFYFEDRTFGLYPTARFQSQFGASLGGRMVHRDLFHNGGTLDVHGTWGGKFGRRLTFDAHTGWLRRSPVRLGLAGEYRLIPADRFYGIGNGDGSDTAPDGPVDALARDRAVSSRFSHELARGGPVLTFRLARPVELDLATTYTWRRFGPSTRPGDDPDTEIAFTPTSLVGYGGLSNLYAQARLRIDTRVARRTAAVVSSGWYASLYGGYTYGLRRDPSRFGRVGMDVQRFIDLFDGSRVLRLRLLVDSAIGSLHRIPFAELPMLGGSAWLRGYPRARFRDRIAAMATAEYTYPIDQHLSGFLFVEPGRVWSGDRSFSLAHLRMGYGGGFQLHTTSKFIARIQFASTISGGFHVYLVFSPPTDPRDPS